MSTMSLSLTSYAVCKISFCSRMSLLQGTEAAVPLWYVMDEFGSRIQHSDDPNVRLVPFCYMPTKSAYTIMWPIVDLKPGGKDLI